MRMYKTLFDQIIKVTNVSRLDDNTLMGREVGSNLSRIFHRELEVFYEGSLIRTYFPMEQRYMIFDKENYRQVTLNSIRYGKDDTSRDDG